MTITCLHLRRSRRDFRGLLAALFLALLLNATAADASKKAYELPAGDAATTLKVFSQQSGEQIVYPVEQVRGVKTNEVKGELATREALDRMLKDTGLVAVQDEKTGALTVKKEVASPNAPRVAQEPATTPKEPGKIEGGVLKLDTFEVMGSRLINADLPRTRDDVRPYVVFDHEQLEKSMAPNLEDFFRSRLPMAQQTQSPESQAGTGASQRSHVDLRGLGSAQTLILVDGRRLPSVSNGISFGQPDINGIPMSMIERIEILPSSASGIYGGGATGGVINIIMRKDYSGFDLTLNYNSPFDTDASVRRVDLNGSFSFDHGRLLATVNYSRVTGTALTAGDRRQFGERGLALLKANNPAGLIEGNTPPLGGSTNIRALFGDLVLTNGTSLHSPLTFVPDGYAGSAADGGAALVANAGQYNLALSPTVGVNGSLSPMRTVPDSQAVGFNLRRIWSKSFETYVDFSDLQNRGENPSAKSFGFGFIFPTFGPNNPFAVPVIVVYPILLSGIARDRSDTLRATAGFVLKLPRDWLVSADYVYGRSRTYSELPQSFLTSQFDADVRSGVVNVFRDMGKYPINFTPYLRADPLAREGPFVTDSKDATLRAAGPVWQLPAGAITLAGNVEWRRQDARAGFEDQPDPSSAAHIIQLNYPLSQTIKSGYLETHLPLASESTGWSWVKNLELEASARRDEYTSSIPSDTARPSAPTRDGPFPPPPPYLSLTNKATKETFGVRYSPVSDVTLRMSWGNGFLSPNLNDLRPGNPATASVGTVTVVDPKRSNVLAPASATIVFGGNPNLRPEVSDSLSGGIIYTPHALPGFRLSVDYTRIKKKDEIATLNFQQMFDFENLFPGVITRAALTPADTAAGYTGGQVTALNSSTVNLAHTEVIAYDIQADYTRMTDHAGEFHVYTIATWEPTYDLQPAPNAPTFNQVGFNTMLKLRGNLGVDWTRGAWSVGWNMQYYQSYLGYSAAANAATIAAFVKNQGTDTIPSQVYHDLLVRYRFGAQAQGWRRFLANTDLTVGVQNVFNALPPPLATTLQLSAYSQYADVRLRRYDLTFRKHF